jgi:Putative heavy-metal-binding
MTEPSPAGFPITTGFELPGMTVERDLEVAFGEDSRRHAIDRMIDNARLPGPNAVVAMRFDSSEIGPQLTETAAYGTAVVPRPTG